MSCYFELTIDDIKPEYRGKILNIVTLDGYECFGIECDVWGEDAYDFAVIYNGNGSGEYAINITDMVDKSAVLEALACGDDAEPCPRIWSGVDPR
jgi:hypothetical protein